MFQKFFVPWLRSSLIVETFMYYVLIFAGINYKILWRNIDSFRYAIIMV